ncbi:MAG: enoyl-CoA hydratase-related protein [Acidimicrobiia bacterium]|nr:enoyl-CoA hydratase-related protein [Acidimicrobiia bacterium]
MADYETVVFEKRDGVAWVTLDRPEVHNAFNGKMAHELQAIWRGLRHDDDVRVAVLTGVGREGVLHRHRPDGTDGGRRRRRRRRRRSARRRFGLDAVPLRRSR